MCRYAFHVYKSHFACFSCRKAFKKIAFEDYVKRVGLEWPYRKLWRVHCNAPKRQELEKEFGISIAAIRDRYAREVSICPECHQTMAWMGLDFRAPPKEDVEAWKILGALNANGFNFANCGCGVGYLRPKRLAEVPAWLERHAKRSEGHKLLESIDRRAANGNMPRRH